MGGSCASAAQQIQCVAFDMDWTFNMLCDVEAAQEWQEFRGKGAPGGVHMDVETTKQECRWKHGADGGEYLRQEGGGGFWRLVDEDNL